MKELSTYFNHVKVMYFRSRSVLEKCLSVRALSMHNGPFQHVAFLELLMYEVRAAFVVGQGGG